MASTFSSPPARARSPRWRKTVLVVEGTTQDLLQNQLCLVTGKDSGNRRHRLGQHR